MELTFIGMIQVVIGILVVFFGSVRSALIFLLVSALFEGSAAIVLPSLGGSSIPPVQFALFFTTLRILAPKGGYVALLPSAIADNKWYVLFAIYGMATAYLGPRMFGGAINVFPMQPDPSLGPFGTVPLSPTPQNLTAGLYLFGAFMLAITSYIFCRVPNAPAALVKALVLISWLHILTGLADILTRGTGMESLLSVFRNSNYSALDNSIAGFVRIRGVLPEASSYAGLGFALFVANAEMWYRSISPRATGLLASMLALILFFSTASTAYVALAAFGIFFLLRAILFPNAAPSGKLFRAAFLGFGILVALCILLAIIPRLPFAVYELIVDMTVGKPASDSGQQRLFWAMQGWHAFLSSYGLGVGPGSFRSSSIITAIMGSMGLIGLITFGLHLKQVFEGSKRSAWGAGYTFEQSLAGALGTAAVFSLVPAAISSPHAVPSALFSIMASAAIALRCLSAAQSATPDRQANEAPRGRISPHQLRGRHA